MDTNEDVEHDAAHFKDVHARAAEAIIATQRGDFARALGTFYSADCDICLAEALAGIAARMGDDLDVETAANRSLTRVLSEAGWEPPVGWDGNTSRP